jgi:hypothetical protein
VGRRREIELGCAVKMMSAAVKQNRLGEKKPGKWMKCEDELLEYI